MRERKMKDQKAVRPVSGPLCPTCGREMQYGGIKEDTAHGRVGKTKSQRVYYYCDRCRIELFAPRPPDGADMQH